MFIDTFRHAHFSIANVCAAHKYWRATTLWLRVMGVCVNRWIIFLPHIYTNRVEKKDEKYFNSIFLFRLIFELRWIFNFPSMKALFPGKRLKRFFLEENASYPTKSQSQLNERCNETREGDDNGICRCGGGRKEENRWSLFRDDGRGRKCFSWRGKLFEIHWTRIRRAKRRKLVELNYKKSAYKVFPIICRPLWWRQRRRHPKKDRVTEFLCKFHVNQLGSSRWMGLEMRRYELYWVSYFDNDSERM